MELHHNHVCFDIIEINLGLAATKCLHCFRQQDATTKVPKSLHDVTSTLTVLSADLCSPFLSWSSILPCLIRRVENSCFLVPDAQRSVLLRSPRLAWFRCDWLQDHRNECCYCLQLEGLPLLQPTLSDAFGRGPPSSSCCPLDWLSVCQANARIRQVVVRSRVCFNMARPLSTSCPLAVALVAALMHSVNHRGAALPD